MMCNRKFLVFIILFSLVFFRWVEGAMPNEYYGGVFYGLGMKQGENGNWDKAAGYFRKAVDSDPGLQKAYFQLGAANLKIQDFSAAVSALLQAIAIDPYDYKAYNLLGLAYREMGELVEASASFDRAIWWPHPPGVEEYVFNSGATRVMLGNMEGAEVRLQHLIDLKEDKLARQLKELIDGQARQ